MRLENILGAGDNKVFLGFHLFVSKNIATQVKSHLPPVANRQNRYLDLFKPFPGAPFAPPVVVCLVLRHFSSEVEGHVLSAGPIRRAVQIVDPHHLIPPGHEVAINAAVIGRPAIHIDGAIIRSDALQAGRINDAHEPLRPSIIGLAQSTDLTGTPFLPRDPFNAFVVILLFFLIQQVVITAGLTGPTHIHVDIHIPLVPHVPFHWPDLPPKEKGGMRQIVGFVLVGGSGEERRELSGSIGSINPKCDTYAIPHRHVDRRFDLHAIPLFLRGRFRRHFPVSNQLSVFDSVPTPSSSTSMLSPECINTCGSRPIPTPDGEPVVTMSPGWKRYHCE